MNDFCIIVFSHADNEEKEEILYNSLLSIKQLSISTILASHIPVSERNQNLCDYYVKDNNNLILSESDIISNPVEISKDIYNTTDYFGGLKFETSVFKKTYQAGVFNLYISAFRFANNIGFKNAILWEFDYVLGDKSVDFINDSINRFLSDGIECLYFNSIINMFNNNIIQKSIDCCYAIPAFFNLEKFNSICPINFINNGKEYNEISRLMIMEQWIKSEIVDRCERKIEYPYDYYNNLLPDTKLGQVHSQRESYLLSGLRSGLYFNDDKTSLCLLFANMSLTLLNSDIQIYNNDGDLILNIKKELYPKNWSYEFLNNEIIELCKSKKGCLIKETVEDLNTNKVDIFEYVINEENIDFVCKLKKFS